MDPSVVRRSEAVRVRGYARSSKHRPCSRRMADGSHTRATKVARLDVYVQSFPGPGTKSQVSRNGGSHPVWRADGRELFYLGPDGTMMSVPIGDGPFIRCRTAAGPLSRKRLDPRAQPGLRRDQRRAALPRHGDATEVQRRGAADRRPQLDGCAQQVAIRSTRTDGGPPISSESVRHSSRACGEFVGSTPTAPTTYGVLALGNALARRATRSRFDSYGRHHSREADRVGIVLAR